MKSWKRLFKLEQMNYLLQAFAQNKSFCSNSSCFAKNENNFDF